MILKWIIIIQTGAELLYAETAEDVLLAEAFTGERPTMDDRRPQANSTGHRSVVGDHVSVRITTEDGSLGTHGLVTQATTAAIVAHRPDCVYACGPAPMLKETARLAESRGASCQVSMESHMACGVGVCLGCVAAAKGEKKFARVCREGPVFAGAEIDWENLR